MNPVEAERRYLRLRPHIDRMANCQSYKDRALEDEMRSAADLAFWIACLDAHKATIDLDDFIVLRVLGAMQNLRRVEGRYRKRHRHSKWGWMDLNVCPYSLPHALDGVSDDARTAAWAIVVHGLADAKRMLYEVLGWARTWESLDELREALTT